MKNKEKLERLIQGAEAFSKTPEAKHMMSLLKRARQTFTKQDISNGVDKPNSVFEKVQDFTEETNWDKFVKLFLKGTFIFLVLRSFKELHKTYNSYVANEVDDQKRDIFTVGLLVAINYTIDACMFYYEREEILQQRQDPNSNLIKLRNRIKDNWERWIKLFKEMKFIDLGLDFIRGNVAAYWDSLMFQFDIMEKHSTYAALFMIELMTDVMTYILVVRIGMRWYTAGKSRVI